MATLFSGKLRLVLGVLSIDRAAVGAWVGADKSAVSRWLQGAVAPSAHNMARLTELIAQHAPGFTLLDWDRDPADLERWLRGSDPDGDGDACLPGTPPRGLTLNVIDLALQTTALRAHAYEGYYRTIRPADHPPGTFAYDYSYVRRAPNGLLCTSMASLGSIAEGWLLPLHNQLFGFVADPTSGSITYSIFNGLASTRIEALDGVGVGASHDAGRTPTALPIYCERCADLSGDAAADEAYFLDLARTAPLPTAADITPGVITQILPDFGPAAAAAGGEWLLQARRSRSLSRSAPPQAQIAAGPHRGDPEEADDDGGQAPFGEKLALVIKMLNLSGGQVAAGMAVHKSVVSRWLSGSVEPAAHNLTRLTALIAQRSPGFTRLDWDRTPAALMRRFGVDPAQIGAGGRAQDGSDPHGGLALPTWPQILATAAARGAAYEGVFRLIRPSAAEPGRFEREYGLVRPHPSGLPRLTLLSNGALFEGWLLTVHDHVHMVAADVQAGVLMFGIFNGLGEPRVGAVDGLIIAPTRDVARSPTAQPAYCEHVEPLSGDDAADERRLADLAGNSQVIDPEALDPAVLDRLSRDCGPAAFSRGGAMVLQMPLDGCLTRAR